MKILKNMISENGVGIRLYAVLGIRPGALKPLAAISFNRILGNLEYGVAIQTARCLALEHRERDESDPIQVGGMGNEMRDNGKGDLCPADYPWPPNFKKP